MNGNGLQRFAAYFWTFMICLFCISMVSAEVYFSPTVKFPGNTMDLYDQQNPDIAFDQQTGTDLTLHMVWENRPPTGPWDIYHRTRNGNDTYSTPLPVDLSGVTDVIDPRILFGFDDPNIGFMASRKYHISTPELFFSEYQVSPGAWNDASISTVPFSDSLVTAPFAVASNDLYMFVAYQPELSTRGIYIHRYDPASNSWEVPEYYSDGNTATRFDEIDLATDNDGYLYMVYHVYNTDHYEEIMVVRSVTTEVTFSGFNLPRQATTGWVSPACEPSLAVTGSSTDVTVAVAWALPDQINVQCEKGGNWAPFPPPTAMGGNATLANGPSSFMVSQPDLAFGPGERLYATWIDMRSMYDEVYFAECFDPYNSGQSFMPEQQLTDGGALMLESSNPVLATTETGNVAVGYNMVDETFETRAYVQWHWPAFFDYCNDFSNWDTANYIQISTAEYTSLPSSIAFNDPNGYLLREFNTDTVEGTLEIRFYDSMNLLDPWHVGLTSLGSKAPGRMIGVNQPASQSDTKYSVNIEDAKVWTDTNVDRSLGWHHIVMNVSSSGIKMYIDPAENPTQISDPFSANFVNFSRVEFVGGSASRAPFYVDDIILTTDITPGTTIPVMNPYGILIALSGFFFILFRKKYRK